jgi:putative phage-type endonuclease
MTTQQRVLQGLVVLTTGEDRAEWAQIRRGVITATAAAAIVGTHPYYKLIDVWNEQTDPDWTPEDARNRWTAAQIDLGTEREPEIIAWANADPRTGGGLVPITAVVHHPDVTWGACSPDGGKRARDNGLVLIECKTGQKDWEAEGIPDHVWDQVQWQLDTTQAVTVWLAYEMYRWISQGRGKPKLPELVKTWLVPIRRDEQRIAYLRARVADFQRDAAEGIAPESDVDLRDRSAYELSPFDEPEDAERKLAELAEAERLDALMAERVELEAQLAAVTTKVAETNEHGDVTWREVTAADRLGEIEGELKAAVKLYHGRRVHLIGQQLVAKLVRYTRKTTDVSDMDEAWRRAHLKYADSERVVIEPNPEYTPDTENESE